MVYLYVLALPITSVFVFDWSSCRDVSRGGIHGGVPAPCILMESVMLPLLQHGAFHPEYAFILHRVQVARHMEQPFRTVFCIRLFHLSSQRNG